jgi:hypothetical protein
VQNPPRIPCEVSAFPGTDLFVAAGTQLAERLKRGNAEPTKIEEVVRRVIDQCVALGP